MRSDQLVDTLFEEFVTAFGSGRDPDVRVFLERAGSARLELGAMIDAYLSLAPIADADEESAVLLGARVSGRSLLAEVRERRGLTLDAATEALRERLGLAADLRERVRQAYEDLERDWLDPRGIHPRVWDALRGLFEIDVRRFVARDDSALAGALFRAERMREPREGVPSPPAEAEGEQDEVDQLFRGATET